MSNIRVLVVDDSAFMRKVISDIIDNDNDLELVGTARNGKDALIKLTELKPDVITLDVEMPEMNGLEALEQILKIRPTPVVMLSSLTEAGAEITIKALAKGAIDFVQKPGGAISLNINQVAQEIVDKVKVAYRVNLDNLIYKTKESNPETINVQRIANRKESSKLNFPLILMGTSTGGPKALHKVLENFQEPLNAAILVVQHMPAGFTKSLAQRLDSLSVLNVKEGEDKEKINPGTVYIAPGNYQMEIKLDQWGQAFLNVHQGPPVTGHRPSVDALFNSVARLGVNKVIAVIMTGMGHDGREGLKNLKQNGALTIAEAEETCIVYGMPKAAVQTGCVDKIVPLDRIPEEIKRNLILLS